MATFLCRADKIDLHAAAVQDVETSFADTFATAGLNISPALVRHASEATGGYPFLIELVGYFLWREAESNAGTLEAEAVGRAIEAAHRRNARTVIEAALSTASPKDMEFLRAMAKDHGPSVAGDIGQRLGAKTNLVANYRTRLLAAGLVESVGFGKVDFAISGLRRYLSSTPADSDKVSARSPSLSAVGMPARRRRNFLLTRATTVAGVPAAPPLLRPHWHRRS